jgi:hypothetical protein
MNDKGTHPLIIVDSGFYSPKYHQDPISLIKGGVSIDTFSSFDWVELFGRLDFIRGLIRREDVVGVYVTEREIDKYRDSIEKLLRSNKGSCSKSSLSFLINYRDELKNVSGMVRHSKLKLGLNHSNIQARLNIRDTLNDEFNSFYDSLTPKEQVKLEEIHQFFGGVVVPTHEDLIGYYKIGINQFIENIKLTCAFTKESRRKDLGKIHGGGFSFVSFGDEILVAAGLSLIERYKCPVKIYSNDNGLASLVSNLKRAEKVSQDISVLALLA